MTHIYSKTARRSCVLGAYCFLVMEAEAIAGILWQNPLQTFHCEAQGKVINAAFNFKIDGINPVKILEVKTSCGCTIAKTTKQAYLPGEAGTIEVAYDAGNQTGLQVKTIAVRTDEPGKPVYTLSLVTYLPEPLKITPRYVFWSAGGESGPKTIMLSAPSASPVRVLSVASNNPEIKVSLVAEKDGKAYLVLVSPLHINSPVRSMLTIETNLQLNGSNRKFFAYADVRPALSLNSTGNN